MYKIKVDIPLYDSVILAGESLTDMRCYFAHEPTGLRFSKPFVESHPEFFEKVEEKSLAEELLEKYDSLDKDYILRKHALQAMQEYHKLYKQKCGNQ